MKTFLKINISFLIFIYVAMAHSQEIDKEDYFFKIYQKYNAQPTSPQAWEQAASKSKSQEYTLVRGDTLWDVSKTLFGDGFFWSKVWSLNPAITNPHQVTIGQIIHFFPGQGLNSPSLTVNSESQNPNLSPQTSLKNAKWWLSQNLQPIAVDLNGVALPPPLELHAPPLDELPPSLPRWKGQSVVHDSGPQIEIVETEKEAISTVLTLPYFISMEDEKVVGTIYEMEKGALTAGEGDELFIDPSGPIQIGDVLTVTREVGLIEDPDAFMGHPMAFEVQGQIKVLSEVDGVYKAVVIKSIFPITLDALVSASRLPQMDLTEGGTLAPAEALVIGGENEPGRSLFGSQSIIYLNRGTADGVSLNQRIQILENHTLRNPLTDVNNSTHKIGEIKIVKTEENYSTAIILWCSEPVMPGDYVGHLPGEGRRSEKPSDPVQTEKPNEFEDGDSPSEVTTPTPKEKEDSDFEDDF